MRLAAQTSATAPPGLHGPRTASRGTEPTMFLDYPTMLTCSTSPQQDDFSPRTQAEAVFYGCAPRVYSVARRMLGQDADAEDVTQEVLLQVLRKLNTFRGESALSTWLHRVTVNAALQHRRKQSRRREQLESLTDLPWQGKRSDGRPYIERAPDEQILNQETRELIEGAIARLPEIYRDVYVLAEVEGLANTEVGELLGLGVPAVKSRLHRARLMMREMLAPHFCVKEMSQC
jgi:RNA polymerase sigma-70 factor (ECF subfamily)